jgi:probable rRNA maturation factor
MAFTKSLPIQFHYLVPPFGFTNRLILKKFIEKMCRKEGKKLDAINFIFCSDDYLLELNQVHLNHNTFTDIITFELSPQGQPLLADIYISVERVRDNARLFNVSFRQELHRVIFHGVLHLCGYRDKKPAEQKLMREMEASWLNKYFL